MNAGARLVSSAAARQVPLHGLAMPEAVGHDGSMLDLPVLEIHLPLAGFSGAKTWLLAMVIALPAILVIGVHLRRSRSR